MAIQEQLLTEEESAQVAGVSIETIRQYQKFGLLERTHHSEGKGFKMGEIANVFHIEEQILNKFVLSRPKETLEAQKSSPQLKIAIDNTETEAVASQTSEPQTNSEQIHLRELNHRLLDEIQSLREERDWLRERMVKLEARSEREQMLLLSSSESLRGIVSEVLPKRRAWLPSLPWTKLQKNKP